MRSIRLFSLAAAAALCAGAGCVSINSVEPSPSSSSREPIPDRRVITDPSLERRVHVVAVQTVLNPGGHLTVQLEVRNTTRRRHAFTYRVQWFDERGILIQLPTAASMPRTLEGRETAFITAMSPTESAKDFRVNLLEL